MNLRRLLAIGGMFLAIWRLSPAQAVGFTEDFEDSIIHSALELSAPGSFTFDGVALNQSGSRAYVRTTGTNYLSVDFTFQITYTVPTSNSGAALAFFGLGAGAPDGDHYGEPFQSVFFRSAPDGFGAGFLQTTLNDGAGLFEEVEPKIADPGPGTGTHRARLTRSGDTLTFAVDEDSATGSFTTDYSTTLSIAGSLGFLNATNSRLFFGSEVTTVTFDSLSVTVSAVPEPASSAAWISGMVGLGALVCRRRRSRFSAKS